MIRYIFLRLYSNGELEDYLSEQIKQGWILDRCRGNLLFFHRGEAVKAPCLWVSTTECTKRRPEEDEEVLEYLAIAAHQGWRPLCVGDVESLLPMRRRLYFQAESRGRKLEEDEAIRFQYARRAHQTTLRWLVLWTLLAAAGLITSFSFMAAVQVHPVFLLLDMALCLLVCSAVFLFFDRLALYRHVTKLTPLRKRSWRSLRKKECALQAGMALLCLGLVLLLFS